MTAARAAARADDQLLRLQAFAQHINDRVDDIAPCVEDRAPADLNHMRVGQHAKDRRFGRTLYIFVEQAFAHQHRLQVLPPIIRFCRIGQLVLPFSNQP